MPGIGEKGAIKLLQDWAALDGIYDHIDEITGSTQKKLIEGKASAYLSKEVARIWTDAPVELEWDVADVNDCDLQKVADILRRLEFTSLMWKRLPKNMQQAADTSLYFHESEEVNLKELPWPETVTMDGPFVLQLVDDEVWLSLNLREVMHAKVTSIDESFGGRLSSVRSLVTTGQLYHDLASQGCGSPF